MADTRSEKLNTSPGAASKEAGADAAGADTVPILIPSAAADRELSDGGAGSQNLPAPRTPPSRAM